MGGPGGGGGGGGGKRDRDLVFNTRHSQHEDQLEDMQQQRTSLMSSIMSNDYFGPNTTCLHGCGICTVYETCEVSGIQLLADVHMNEGCMHSLSAARQMVTVV